MRKERFEFREERGSVEREDAIEVENQKENVFGSLKGEESEVNGKVGGDINVLVLLVRRVGDEVQQTSEEMKSRLFVVFEERKQIVEMSLPVFFQKRKVGLDDRLFL